MPPPVAQLGYMPNMHAPSARPNYAVRNPWQDLAMQVLASVAQQGVQNTMARDYASQATAESPERVTAGAPISPMTGQPVADSGGVAGTLGPKDAPWWQKALQGPQMGERQYAQVSAQRAGSAEKKADRSLTTTENAADRGLRERLQKDQLGQAASQFNQTYDLSTKELGLKSQAQTQRAKEGDAEILTKGQMAANDTLRAQTGASTNSAQERAAVALNDQYADYLMKYAKESTAAQVLGKPLPPPMSVDQFRQQYDQFRSTVGLPMMGTTPAAR